MAAKVPVIVSDRVWIPIKALPSLTDLKDHYTTHRFNEANCKNCEYLPDRMGYNCESCEAYLGAVKLYTTRTVNKRDCIGIPVGDKKNFERCTGLLFKDIRIIDRRTRAPFTVKFKFIVGLRDYQAPVVAKFLKRKYGLIEAPPRTGKTLMMLYCCFKMGQRTLILASQHEFLTQFIDHIQGNEKEGIPKCTNLPELEKKYKKKLYGFPKTDEDFETMQIFCMTYQQFISEKNGKNRLKKVSPHIGTIGVDEVHKCSATEFAKVVSSFPALYKMGVSATVKRKDGLEFVIKSVIGPVVARSKIEALTPTVIIHKTDAKPKRKYVGRTAWTYAMQFLSKDKKRNELIVDWVMKDLANGHNIVIPVYYKNHVVELQRMINARYGKPICGIFVGGGSAKNKAARRQTLSDAKAGKLRVIIGIRSLLQLGLNVPAWSCIYTAMPISNEPNYKQETSRVRTPMDGKRSPVIRLFFDAELGQSIGCARSCIRHMLGFKYKFKQSSKQSELFREVMGKSRRGDSDSYDAEFKPTRTRL